MEHRDDVAPEESQLLEQADHLSGRTDGVDRQHMGLVGAGAIGGTSHQPQDLAQDMALEVRGHLVHPSR